MIQEVTSLLFKTYLAKQFRCTWMYFARERFGLCEKEFSLPVLPQNGERCRISPPHVNRWSCEGLRSSLTTASRCWPTHKLEMGSAATSCISKPARIVSVQFLICFSRSAEKCAHCKEFVKGWQIKKGACLVASPIHDKS